MKRPDRISIPAGVAGIGLLLFLLAGCHAGDNPTPPSGNLLHIETILPAEKRVASVSPDGRRLLFYSANDVVLLDVTTKQKLWTLPRLARVQWVDDELLYGERESYPAPEHFVLNLQPRTVVKIESLPAASTALARYIRTTSSIYVLEAGGDVYTLLLLQRDAAGNVSGGYVVPDTHNLAMLLSGVPHKVSPPALFSNVAGEKHPSPDGQYYYLRQHQNGQLDALEIYSPQGELLSAVTATAPYPILTCHGWAWDSRGVYYQAADPAGMVRGSRWGPFQVLEANP